MNKLHEITIFFFQKKTIFFLFCPPHPPTWPKPPSPLSLAPTPLLICSFALCEATPPPLPLPLPLHPQALLSSLVWLTLSPHSLFGRTARRSAAASSCPARSTTATAIGCREWSLPMALGKGRRKRRRKSGFPKVGCCCCCRWRCFSCILVTDTCKVDSVLFVLSFDSQSS